VIDAFRRDAKFDNSAFTLADVKKAQASMREARTALLDAIAEEYKKTRSGTPGVKLRFFETAFVPMYFDQLAGCIVNADHSRM
jgi:hypothetical protein